MNQTIKTKIQLTYPKLANCKAKYKYIIDDTEQPYDMVSNNGLKRFERCYVVRNGEYHDFCVEAQEDIASILTNNHIKLALEAIEKNDITKAMHNLNMTEYHRLLGDDVIYYVIDEWLKVNKIEQIFNMNIDTEDLLLIDKLNKYIRTERHHPIDGKIKIVNIGTNSKTKESVVPPDWLGRIFDSGTELHSEMNKLPHRKGKPPVSYCCIYSNTIERNTIWLTDPKMNTMNAMNIICNITIDARNNIVSDIMINNSDDHVKGSFMIISAPYIDNDHKIDNIYISVDKSLLNRSKERTKTESVGYLSSLLQKCIRRGSHNGSLLKNVCKKLNESPTYNLPDHNFATVSGSRQLLWRSYISIVEDAKGYIVDTEKNTNTIDMRSLVLLAIIFQKDPTLKLSNKACEILTTTMLHIQASSEQWKWRHCKHTNVLEQYITFDLLKKKEDQINTSIYLAINNMPMMSNDKSMLERVYTYTYFNMNDSECDIKDMSVIKSMYFILADELQDKIEQQETQRVGMDMHCKPTMLIELQAMIDLSLLVSTKSGFKFPTLERLAKYIWDNYSCRNFRDNTLRHESIYKCDNINDEYNLLKFDNNVYASIATLQEHYVFDKNRCKQHIDWFFTVNKKNAYSDNNDMINIDHRKRIGRTTWLIIFGKKHRFSYNGKVYDIFLGGNDSMNPCKIKRTIKGISEYVDGDLRKKIQGEFLKKQHNVTTKIKLADPPEGYKWIYKDYVEINYDHTKQQFYVNKNPVETLNLFDSLKKLPSCNITPDYKMSDELINMIKTTTYSTDNGDDIFRENLLYRLSDATFFRRMYGDCRVFNWIKFVKHNTLSRNIWRLVMSRIYTSDTDGVNGKFILPIGPCDRRGKKTSNSISYKFEGCIYRMICLLEMLYPFALKRKNDSMRWSVDKNIPEYYHMMNSIKELCKLNKSNKNKDQLICNDNVEIITPLWPHQEITSDKIFQGCTHDKKRGFGDASQVGSGKTLCALSVCSKLYAHDRAQKHNDHSGFLVMVPTISLIKTWTDEIKKHTRGFEYLVQNANGTFSDMNNNIYKLDQLKIKSNTVIITTMGRMRDHPVQHAWIIVIIDECLSVQNKEALQTEEAWRQSCYSEYGIIMLSATFFRSRFDKMLYMIKMLKSGLPEDKEYLDAILDETIVSNVTESKREWIISESKIPLTKTQRETYDDVYKANSTKGSETLYTALMQYIHKNIDYIEIFLNQVKEIENDDTTAKIIIFTKSKIEADNIVLSKNNQNITRYPDKTGSHVVLSLSEGTYGLNDLIVYNTLLMRPPEPDKLPQIKGRLDRPGQEANKLYIRYVVLQNTIEEASLVRLDICNKFYNNYLMPLAEFYDIAAKISHNIDNDNNIDIIDISKTKVKSKNDITSENKINVNINKMSKNRTKTKRDIVRVKKVI